jgi:hypothetical protein
MMKEKSHEHQRLHLKDEGAIPPWKKWGAYLSERSWGTVREDYSENGDAWSYLTHDMARSKAYRWGEDGLCGISDYFQSVAFSFAFWNGQDPILKERLFGLNPYEGNHGEDVKECYYYLDATPTHSYLKFLYKYPHAAFPYERLTEENKKRTALDREFEIYDTGVFDDGKYFDIFVEYAKANTEDICIKIEVWNRGAEAAPIHVIPHLWFRNRWSWKDEVLENPSIHVESESEGLTTLFADASKCLEPLRTNLPYENTSMYLYGATPKETLFTCNETNSERISGKEAKNRTPHVKDAFHRYIINKEECVSKEKGSKSCFNYGPVMVQPNEPYVLVFRLSSQKLSNPLKDVESWIQKRLEEADEFYSAIQGDELSSEDKLIQRTALSGMIWSQQLYIYDVKQWLKGDKTLAPPPPGRGEIRNGKWTQLYACDVMSMPDKWEYPWFAAWDLSFHALAFSLIDIDFAKEQLVLLIKHWFQNTNGQIPAYEWNFSDLNPPVQAWAFWKVYQKEKKARGKGDRKFLLFGFLKLIENFSWWVNKVDKLGNNFFEGGFLGLDNISVIDRSEPLPDGGVIEQSDATGWMGFYTLWMMKIALELSKEEPAYEQLATSYFEQFIYISRTIHQTHNMWDEEDGFFYDVILKPDGESEKLKVRSFVGIIPFYSLLFIEEDEMTEHADFYERFLLFKKHNEEDVDRCVVKVGSKYLISLMNIGQMKRVLSRVFDPEEFLSDYGLRSVSKFHEKNPLKFQDMTVGYEPGESLERIKGGNSNWRGPIWFPTNYLVFDALGSLIDTVGEDFVIDQSNKTLKEAKEQLVKSLVAPFQKNSQGYRPVHGDCKLYQDDPYWKDLLLFYEHYHGDTGRGLGASHQTGWSGLVSNIIFHL